MDTIAQRIRALRESRKLSMTKLGNAIGFSSGNISDWETGRSKPTISALESLSDFFDISIDWIVKGKEVVSGEVLVKKTWQEELSPVEREIVNKIKELDDEGKLEVLHFVKYTHYQQAKGGRLSISTSTGEQAAGNELA